MTRIRSMFRPSRPARCRNETVPVGSACQRLETLEAIVVPNLFSLLPDLSGPVALVADAAPEAGAVAGVASVAWAEAEQAAPRRESPSDEQETRAAEAEELLMRFSSAGAANSIVWIGGSGAEAIRSVATGEGDNVGGTKAESGTTVAVDVGDAPNAGSAWATGSTSSDHFRFGNPLGIQKQLGDDGTKGDGWVVRVKP